MSSSKDFLTTKEFADKAGVSTSTVSKWLRTKKIEGQKKGRKWIIAAAEIAKVTTAKAQKSETPSKKTKPKASESAGSGKAYSVKEFSEMTYLTEFGVEKWLKEGRLVRAVDGSGQTMVAASNIDLPGVKRLLR